MSSNLGVLLALLAFGAVLASEDTFFGDMANARAAWKSPMETIKDCQKKENVSDEMLMKVNPSSRNLTATEVPQELKCFVVCTLERFEMIVDGKIAKDTAMQFVKIAFAQDPAKAAARTQMTEDAISTCEKEIGEEKVEGCDLGYKVMECYFRFDKKILRM